MTFRSGFVRPSFPAALLSFPIHPPTSPPPAKQFSFLWFPLFSELAAFRHVSLTRLPSMVLLSFLSPKKERAGTNHQPLFSPLLPLSWPQSKEREREREREEGSARLESALLTSAVEAAGEGGGGGRKKASFSLDEAAPPPQPLLPFPQSALLLTEAATTVVVPPQLRWWC